MIDLMFGIFGAFCSWVSVNLFVDALPWLFSSTYGMGRAARRQAIVARCIWLFVSFVNILAGFALVYLYLFPYVRGLWQ